MTIVGKRDGRAREFVPEKIVTSAVKSGATPEIAGQIRYSAGASISTLEIRERVPDELGRVNPRWREYREVYGRPVKPRT